MQFSVLNTWMFRGMQVQSAWDHILAVSNSASFMFIGCRIKEIWSHKITMHTEPWNLKDSHLQMRWGCTMLKQVFIKLIFAVSNGTNSMSAEGRVQEMISHKFTHAHQNPETWLILWAHSSISDRDVTTHPYKHQSLLHPTVQTRCS